MQQMYDLWLSLTNQNRRSDGTLMTPPPEEKQTAMPVDYAESVVGDWPTWLFSSSFIIELRGCTLNLYLLLNPMKNYSGMWQKLCTAWNL